MRGSAPRTPEYRTSLTALSLMGSIRFVRRFSPERDPIREIARTRKRLSITGERVAVSRLFGDDCVRPEAYAPGLVRSEHRIRHDIEIGKELPARWRIHTHSDIGRGLTPDMGPKKLSGADGVSNRYRTIRLHVKQDEVERREISRLDTNLRSAPSQLLLVQSAHRSWHGRPNLNGRPVHNVARLKVVLHASA